METVTQALTLVRLGIDTQHEFVVYIQIDCFVYRSEGFQSMRRVLVTHKNKSVIATLNIITSDILSNCEASLSESAFDELDAAAGDTIFLSHITPVTSFKYVRSKIYGKKLDKNEYHDIIHDIVAGKYSPIEISSFITASAKEKIDIDEISHLTHAMINTGKQIAWDYPVIIDKHSVGGIPGNRTTPLVVAIVSAAGMIIPKTSSRAITSPAGTADTIETMTRVDLNENEMREVIEKEGGCMVWGGTLGISPADDILIQIERPLDIDPEGQMIASVLSKKAAIGATHVVIDIPVGPTAKIRTQETFLRLKECFTVIGHALGLQVFVYKSDGIQPLGRGIGPSLEAKDILSILRNKPDAPIDLKNKSIKLAATMLEFGKKLPIDRGIKIASDILESGGAYDKFLAICEAQGGFHEPTDAIYQHTITASHSGIIQEIDNRNLATIAKLAGAPHDQAAGIEFFAAVGKQIEKGQPLYKIHAMRKGSLQYAIDYAKTIPMLIKLRRD